MVTSQDIYCASQDLLGRNVFGRAILFRGLGGILRRPDPQAFLPEEDVWQADLFGILRTGDSCDAAILAWARDAKASTPLRGTDGRPDCPYNGQGLAPNSIPTPAA
jgi:hypothetical protein